MLGYLYEDEIIELIESVGFVFEGGLDINNNEKDMVDYLFGVWILLLMLCSVLRGEDLNLDFD